MTWQHLAHYPPNTITNLNIQNSVIYSIAWFYFQYLKPNSQIPYLLNYLMS